MGIAEKLVTIAENEQKVYEAGQKAEYDRFWDNYQQNGTRTNYVNGFGQCWTKETFKPKHRMKPTDAYMFLRYAPLGSIDLVEHLDELGVTLDFSYCTNLQYAFYWAHISRLGVMDLRKIKGASADGVFSSPYIKTIDLLKVSEEQTNLNWFSDASGLENITVEGVIAADLKLSRCSNLTHDSLMSIINALKDFRTYKTYTYSGRATDGDLSSNAPKNSIITVTNNKSNGDTLYLEGITENGESVYFEIRYFLGIEDCSPSDLDIKTFSYSEDEESSSMVGYPIYDYEITHIKPYIEPTVNKTLTLHADAKARLTEDELKIATDKGWTLA